MVVGVDITESTVVLPVVDGVVDTVPLVFTDVGLLAATAAVEDRDWLTAAESILGVKYLIAYAVLYPVQSLLYNESFIHWAFK